MTIKTTDSIGNYININPIKANFNDNIDCTVFTMHIINDNMTNGCVFKYQLYSVDETGGFFMKYYNTLSMTGDDYTNWTGDNVTAYNYACNILNLVSE